jgi:hypothetical protein
MASVTASRGIALGLLLALGAAVQAQTPRTITIRGEALADARARLRAGDRRLEPARAALLARADRALEAPLIAVTDKRTLLPPTNDPHDYYSLSPYWWPDTTKADGLPYIRKDGITNPESKRDLDQPRVAEMGARVRDLSLAWYFTGDEHYATRGARQLRAWFLDSASRMNPHLRFAQLVRGNPNERGSGIIDTRWFIEAVDAAQLLRGSKAWTDQDHQALQGWFRAYLSWLRASPNGKHEQAAVNNHGSWFAAQTISYALFVGDSAVAREIALGVKDRIGKQITPAGEQPIENDRTRSMHYAAFNLEALGRVAEAGRHVGIDLWSYEAPTGGSLRKAITFVGGFLPDPKRWPGTQLDAFDLSNGIVVLRRGNHGIAGRPFAKILASLPADAVRRDLSALVYPDR